jgi:hypothetical protein
MRQSSAPHANARGDIFRQPSLVRRSSAQDALLFSA